MKAASEYGTFFSISATVQSLYVTVPGCGLDTVIISGKKI